MKTSLSAVLTSAVASLLIVSSCSSGDTNKEQIREAAGVISRILPDHSDRFILKLIEQEGNNDVFEIEPADKRIVIRGSSGVAICSGFNYYLKNYCNCSYNWRCGNNMNIRGDLPCNFEKIRKVTPYEYRYIFNYCTFSYSMSFWDWEQWEKMIDWMALNGINMPLAPMGQEIIWQRVYEKMGIPREDLKDFFVGPAYNAFGRMGCIDGFGGPLPQSWIENEAILQKMILERERNLGMKPVLQGFTGHIPSALIKKYRDIKYTSLVWLDFPATFVLSWEDPMFMKIGQEFIKELTKEYGSDHLYAIDQFIEMQPATGDTTYLKNMGRTIFSAIDSADPGGIWVIQTWPFKELTFWNRERTRAYFDGAPDDRMIALELMGESWFYTGWYKHDGWYGKPWVWSVISNFGDNVSMFGGLPQIAENFSKALSDPARGNLRGMGLMMEGLDYNPPVYEFVADMMWEKEVPDPDSWKKRYLMARYGTAGDSLKKGWDYIFDHYYTKSGLFEMSPAIKRPAPVTDDIRPSEAAVKGACSLIEASAYLGDNDAYKFDLVNLFRQVFGQYSGHILYEITKCYRERDIPGFERHRKEFFSLCRQLEKLMATRQEFLFGKWIDDSQERATSQDEKKLYEWNARAIITTWGGGLLYGYAIKDWAGLYTSYYLPKWEKLFDAMKTEMTGGKKLDYEKFVREIKQWENNWINLHEDKITALPEGNTVELASEMWHEYSGKLVKD